MNPYQYQTHPIYILQRSNANSYASAPQTSPTMFSSPPHWGMPPSDTYPTGPQRQNSLPGNVAQQVFQQAAAQAPQPTPNALETSYSYLKTLSQFNKLKKSDKLTSELEIFAEKEKHFLDTLCRFYFKEQLISGGYILLFLFSRNHFIIVIEVIIQK